MPVSGQISSSVMLKMNRKTKIIAFGVAALIVVAGVVSIFVPTLEYTPDEFKVISEGLTDEGIKLVIKVPPESIFYCPGATCEKSNGVIQFSIVRSHIDSKPIVDVPAQRRTDGSLALLFPLDFRDLANGKSVELVDSSGHSYGSWSIPH